MTVQNRAGFALTPSYEGNDTGDKETRNSEKLQRSEQNVVKILKCNRIFLCVEAAWAISANKLGGKTIQQLKTFKFRAA